MFLMSCVCPLITYCVSVVWWMSESVSQSVSSHSFFIFMSSARFKNKIRKKSLLVVASSESWINQVKQIKNGWFGGEGKTWRENYWKWLTLLYSKINEQKNRKTAYSTICTSIIVAYRSSEKMGTVQWCRQKKMSWIELIWLNYQSVSDHIPAYKKLIMDDKHQ